MEKGSRQICDGSNPGSVIKDSEEAGCEESSHIFPVGPSVLDGGHSR